MSWQPSLGALPTGEGVHFRVWAPRVRSVEVVVERVEVKTASAGAGDCGSLSSPEWEERESVSRNLAVFPMQRRENGEFEARVPSVRIGDRYRYLVDGLGPFPDPASRFQPEGVHGPSEVVDPSCYAWRDDDWRGVPPGNLVLYELHIGTFTPEGTFAAAAERLADLAELGITAIELMPVAAFPGRRNWGYDGVDLFAPSHQYGTPDDLRRLVDRAHAHGLAVLLDVVYNHFGPDGNYLGAFSPYYVSSHHRTAWGEAVNLDGPHSESVRAFVIENALHWLVEYHLDGLRLDATHALRDEGPRHLLAELSARVRATILDRPIHLIAEDNRNLATMLKPENEGGWGLDGVWADDFHHQFRRLLAGDTDGVYRDFRGSVADLAETVNRGWFFCGAYSIHRDRLQGTDPTGIEPHRFVFCIQNHDRIGNRAFGERLHHQIDPAAYRAASALLLLAPATPLLFMGQEWAASTPFLFFTDHHAELGEQVRQGRRREFRHYQEFSDPATLDRLPDPQDEATFRACQLNWEERAEPSHAAVLRLYRALLRLRRDEPALQQATLGRFIAVALDDATLALRRDAVDGPSILLVSRFHDSGNVTLDHERLRTTEGGDGWAVLLTTEDRPYTSDSDPPRLVCGGPVPEIDFARPSAIVLRAMTPPTAPGA